MLETLNRPLPKRQIGRLMLVDLGVVLVLLLFPIRTSWKQFGEASRGRRDKQQQQLEYTLRLSQAVQAERLQPTLAGEIRSAVEVLEMNTRRLEQPEDSALIQEDLRRLVEARGLAMIGLSPREPVEGPGYQVRVFNLRTEGSFARHLRLIHDLRSSNVFLAFDRLNLVIANPETRPPGLRMEVELRTVLVPPSLSRQQIAAMLADTTGASSPRGTPPDSTGRPRP
jgi:hypothetical protein